MTARNSTPPGDYVEALDAGDTRAALPIAVHKKRYKIEEEIRELDPDAKLEVRQAQSDRHVRPLMTSFFDWARATRAVTQAATSPPRRSATP